MNESKMKVKEKMWRRIVSFMLVFVLVAGNASSSFAAVSGGSANQSGDTYTQEESDTQNGDSGGRQDEAGGGTSEESGGGIGSGGSGETEGATGGGGFEETKGETGGGGSGETEGETGNGGPEETGGGTSGEQEGETGGGNTGETGGETGGGNTGESGGETGGGTSGETEGETGSGTSGEQEGETGGGNTGETGGATEGVSKGNSSGKQDDKKNTESGKKGQGVVVTELDVDHAIAFTIRGIRDDDVSFKRTHDVLLDIQVNFGDLPIDEIKKAELTLQLPYFEPDGDEFVVSEEETEFGFGARVVSAEGWKCQEVPYNHKGELVLTKDNVNELSEDIVTVRLSPFGYFDLEMIGELSATLQITSGVQMHEVALAEGIRLHQEDDEDGMSEDVVADDREKPEESKSAAEETAAPEEETEVPTEESKAQEKPKEESKEAEKPKEESGEAVKPKEESKATEKPKEETKATEKPKEETKAAEKPKEESKATEQPKEESKATEAPTKESQSTEKPKQEPKETEKSKAESQAAGKPTNESKPADNIKAESKITGHSSGKSTGVLPKTVNAGSRLAKLDIPKSMTSLSEDSELITSDEETRDFDETEEDDEEEEEDEDEEEAGYKYIIYSKLKQELKYQPDTEPQMRRARFAPMALDENSLEVHLTFTSPEAAVDKKSQVVATDQEAEILVQLKPNWSEGTANKVHVYIRIPFLKNNDDGNVVTGGPGEESDMRAVLTSVNADDIWYHDTLPDNGFTGEFVAYTDSVSGGTSPAFTMKLRFSGEIPENATAQINAYVAYDSFDEDGPGWSTPDVLDPNSIVTMVASNLIWTADLECAQKELGETVIWDRFNYVPFRYTISNDSEKPQAIINSFTFNLNLPLSTLDQTGGVFECNPAN